MNKKICAVVVTYNRKRLLKECINSIFNQTIPINCIIVIDNASSDGTPEFLFEKGYIKELPKTEVDGYFETEIDFIKDGNLIKFNYIRMNKNTGGSGGFYEGIKKGVEKNYDFLWIMDDDVMAENNCLEILYKDVEYLSKKVSVGFVCPNPYNIDGKPDLMSVPPVVYKINSFVYTSFYTKENKIIPISSCGFGGVLVSRDAIKKSGFPIKEFFIWNDDYEWTRRMVRNGFLGFISLDAKIVHKSKNTGVDPRKLSVERLPLLYYEIRNKAFLFRQDFNFFSFIRVYFKFFIEILYKILKRKDLDKRFYVVFILLKGFIDGLFFKPKIEKP